jgi:VanZ family protein
VLNKKFWYSPIPSIIWVFVIAVGSFIPSSTIPSLVVSDKWIHFVFYAIFSFLLFLSSLSNTNKSHTVLSRWTYVFIIGVIVGVLVEIIQHSFISGRHGEWMDIAANSSGLVFALIISEIIKSKGVL